MIAAAFVLAADLAALVAQGDGEYARRADGATGAHARPGPVDQAIVSYRAAVAADADSNQARGRLVRALFFRASFCDAPADERRRLLEDARAVADEGLRRLDARVGTAKGPARLAALRRVPDAAALHFWAAVAWGEWAVARGTFAAARQGAAGKVRDLGQAVVDLDPAYEQGGGYRILGRLHAEAPKIPFVTGWVSRDLALRYLRLALELGPTNTVNQVFLAEAILQHDAGHRDEAERLLTACAQAAPRAELLVEDAFYVDRARQLQARPR
jgi:hypothetical protein